MKFLSQTVRVSAPLALLAFLFTRYASLLLRAVTLSAETSMTLMLWTTCAFVFFKHVNALILFIFKELLTFEAQNFNDIKSTKFT